MVSPTLKPGRVALIAAIATVLIFGALVLVFTLQLRERLRAEVLRREAEAMHAVALFQLGPADLRLSQIDPEFVIDDVFAAVLESSRLRGVFAVQLFDAKGSLRQARPLAPDDAAATRWWGDGLSEPRARFVAEGSLEQVSPLLALQAQTTARLPLLEIAVPLHRTAEASSRLGVARYWVNGAPVAAEFTRTDRALAVQAGVAFAGGALLISVVLAWAYSRLVAANRRLIEQSADLARANEELDFAAKTGALGAISAHLIHGLKNPLAGIEGFVAEAASAGKMDPGGDAWRTAMETAQRLRVLVNEVTAVLRDEEAGEASYAVPADEVVAAARIRAAPAAEQAGVTLATAAAPEVKVAARTANLAGLVLANLIANALDASSRGGRVTIDAQRQNDAVDFIVSDTGPGLPANVREALFRPVRSMKRGGGGVGLAISHRLAKHAGGELDLVRSDASGTVFRLRVPAVG